MLTFEAFKKKFELEGTEFVEDSSESDYRALFDISGTIVEAETYGEHADTEKVQTAMDKMEEAYGEVIKQAKGLAFMLQYGPEVDPFEVILSETVLFPYYDYRNDAPIGMIAESDDAALTGKIKLTAVFFGL